MDDDDSFQHAPLNASKQQIRLLRTTWPTSRTEVPTYEISIFDLDRAPAYKALSYMWGEAASRHAIELNGRRMTVLPNLFKFLQTLPRIQEGRGYWWIDQLCINQLDDIERSSQVLIMDQIYVRAITVVIWLGSSKSLSFLEQLQWYGNRGNRYDKAVLIKDPEIRNRTFREAIIDHPYWRRLWIVQEIMLAQQLMFACNEVFCFWGSIDWFRDQFSDPNHPLAWFMQEKSKEARDGPWKKQKRKLQDVLRITKDSICWDPRDRVYGLQALVRDYERLQVDYATKTAQEVCFDAITAMVVHQERFEVPIPKVYRELIESCEKLCVAMISGFELPIPAIEAIALDFDKTELDVGDLDMAIVKFFRRALKL